MEPFIIISIFKIKVCIEHRWNIKWKMIWDKWIFWRIKLSLFLLLNLLRSNYLLKLSYFLSSIIYFLVRFFLFRFLIFLDNFCFVLEFVEFSCVLGSFVGSISILMPRLAILSIISNFFDRDFEFFNFSFSSSSDSYN